MTKSSESIIQLNKDKFYGKGTHKKCFIHPQDANLCIKIPYNEGGKIDLLREIKYLNILKIVIKITVFYQNIMEKSQHL